MSPMSKSILDQFSIRVTGVLSVGLCLLMFGCRSFETHAWMSPENAERFYKRPPVAEQDRSYVNPDHLYRPTTDQTSAAENLLADTSFVRLTWDQFETLSGKGRISEPKVAPYLVRAVAWDRPWYSLVFFDRTTGILYTEQVTYNGEMYWPRDWRATALPVIALLDHAPIDAKAYAVWGGDNALTHWSSPHAWSEKWLETEQ